MTQDVPTAPLTSQTGLMALSLACREAGLDPSGARLLRLGQNALYTIDSAPIVVRVARSTELVDRVTCEVDTARWLAELDFPAVRLAPDLPQVVEAADRLVTFWQRASDTGEMATTADLGRILRDLHALPEPPFPLSTFDPFVALRERLTSTEEVADEDLTYLEELAELLGQRYRTLTFDAPFGFIHADAHRNNLIVTPSRVLLSDFEWVARGPREWDVTPTAVAAQRFGLSAPDYQAFVDAYGLDITTWAGYPTVSSQTPR